MDHINHNVNSRKRSYEVHALDQPSHAYHGNMIAPSTTFQWHDMAYAPPTIEGTHFAPTSAPVQYSTASMMSFSPIDYTRHDFSYSNTYSDSDNAAAVQTNNLYRVGPFRYSDLANIDGDAASVSQESIYSRSTRLHSLTDSERRDSQANSILSSNDVRRESEGFDRIFPMSSIDSETCQSNVCGPEPPCLDLANLTPIEECTSVPCMSAPRHFIAHGSSPGPNEKRERKSPTVATRSEFTSPTTLTFEEPTATDASKTIKPRRMPRSKSANAGVGDGTALEKASKLRARQAHSLVERKYRDNLNLKISQLHQTLQNTRYGPISVSRSPTKELKSDYFDYETLVSPDMPNEKTSTGSTPTAPKVRKSDVLTEAMNYVNVAEVEMSRMSEEIVRLNAHVKRLEKLIRCEDCSLLKSMVTLQVEGQQALPKQ